MQAIVGNEALNGLLKELAIGNVSELIRDSLVTEILCKISDFSDEVKHFEEKYGKSFPEFNKEYEKGEEDFEKFDDLMAWEFAQQGKQYCASSRLSRKVFRVGASRRGQSRNNLSPGG